MQAQLRRLLLVFVVLSLPSCATGERAFTWTHAEGRAHPLAGRIWAGQAEGFISRPALLDALAEADFILLGERHDNRDHHRLQAEIIGELARRGRRPAVALEMIDEDQVAALAAYLGGPRPEATGLGPAIGWDKTGWPPWPDYQPIAEAALAAGLTLRGANLPRRIVRQAVSDGAPAVPEPRRSRMNLERPLDAASQAAMQREIANAHCGMLPEGLLPGMAFAQRLRDAAMADSLLASTGDGAVLIAGAGHVRKDRGVPMHLRERTPQRRTAALAFREVEDGLTAPDPADLPYDYVWFTTRVERGDPCAQMRRAPRPGG